MNREPCWTTHLPWTAMSCAALLACGRTSPGAQAVDAGQTSGTTPTTQASDPATHPGTPTPATTGIPSSGPGSTRWEVALDYDAAQAYGVGGPWTDGGGNLFTIGVNGGKITAEKRDASGALQGASELDPACSQGCAGLGATEDGRFATTVTSCPLGYAYRPTASKVTLLDAGGGIASEFTTGWGSALVVNRFGETYAVSSDVGSPVVPDPSGDRLVSAGPLLLRLIGANGADLWVDRGGSLLPLQGSFRAAPDGGAIAIAASGTAAFRTDRAGALLWTADLPVTVTPYVQPYTAVLRDGSLVVAVDTRGLVAFGAGQAGAAGELGRALLVVGSDGRPRTIVALPANAPGDPRNVGVTASIDGGVIAWEFAATCERLWAFLSDLSLSWERQLDASCGSSIASAVSTREGLVLLVGPRLSAATTLVSLQQ